MKRPRLYALLSALGVVLALTLGCAGPAAETARPAGPCLPAAVAPEFFFWPVVGFRSLNLVTEDGELVGATWVLYRRGKLAVAAMWVQSDLVAVDPAPESDAPEWVDLSLVIPLDGKLVLRRTPDAPCRWERWEVGVDASLLLG